MHSIVTILKSRLLKNELKSVQISRYFLRHVSNVAVNQLLILKEPPQKQVPVDFFIKQNAELRLITKINPAFFHCFSIIKPSF